MGLNPSILFGRVMHHRTAPKENKFTYKSYYLALPLSKLASAEIAYNKSAVMSFFEKDHVPYDGSNLEDWARSVLEEHSIREADGEIILFAMPRIFGFIFNPVSFWMSLDKAGELRAVLCEVCNTYAEHHIYICAHSDHRPINPSDTLTGKKYFHVSPMLKREGSYDFRFELQGNRFQAIVNYQNPGGTIRLLTSLKGHLEPLTKRNRRKALWRHPFITLKTISLIHWQALKLFVKGIRYNSKPDQLPQKMTTTKNLDQS